MTSATAEMFLRQRDEAYAEVARLRAENEALERSWGIDATHRDDCYAALKAVWGDMRGMDKHHVPADVITLVRDAIGSDLDKHDPAYRAPGEE
jgi:hypothetical protein